MKLLVLEGTGLGLDGLWFVADEDGIIEVPDHLWHKRDLSLFLPVEVISEKEEQKQEEVKEPQKEEENKLVDDKQQEVVAVKKGKK